MNYGNTKHVPNAETEPVLWKITPLTATWLASPQNFLFASGVLTVDSHVLELGCGISGLISLALSPLVKSYIATDQDYVLKLLRENIAQNSQAFARSSHQTAKGTKKSKKTPKGDEVASNILTSSLDWEKDSQSNLYSELHIPEGESIDLLVACDCIYNTYLIDPLVNTCAEICRLAPSARPTVVLIAQQLRSSDVFETWLTAFHEKFHVWRAPDELLDEDLREGKGFALNFGILRGST
jgi:predicted nicotinamide N-methyase